MRTIVAIVLILLCLAALAPVFVSMGKRLAKHFRRMENDTDDTTPPEA